METVELENELTLGDRHACDERPAVLLFVDINRDFAAALVYVGSSLGAVFAGDYFSLFFFWEIMAISSVLLVIFRRREASTRAGFRYLIIHIAGGCLLLGGIVIQWGQTGSIDFVAPGRGSVST